MLETGERALLLWVQRITEDVEEIAPDVDFGPWVQEILGKLAEQVQQLPDGLRLTPPGSPTFGRMEIAALRDLQCDFIITYMINLPSNPELVCRARAVRALLADVSRVAGNDTTRMLGCQKVSQLMVK